VRAGGAVTTPAWPVVRLGALATLAVLTLAGAAGPARAGSPWDGQRPPDDPAYDVAEEDPVGHTFNDEHWWLYSFLPKGAPAARDPEGSSGMFVDRAWRRFTTGDPRVRIAYVEGGVNWADKSGRQELAERAYLNVGELPRPQRADGSACRYDCNRDGQVNVADYAADKRVRRGHPEITPADLIAAFSDGRDDDGNGYADDVSGWNFSRGGNDPQTEDATYTRGNDFMKRIVGEADNGVGGVGVCPHCTLIPIKAGDEGLDRTDRIAQSIFYAVDAKASVIVTVSTELGYSSLTRAALDYAWRKGVVVVQTSDDFDATAHQDAMYWPHSWPGNGIVSDQSGPVARNAHTAGAAQSFRQRSNYTSFGAHALFAVPSADGSTGESASVLAGVAGLVTSWGRIAADRGMVARPPTGDELKQVIRATASPIDDPRLGWPGRPGATFNVHYGYGRPNVERAMEAIAAKRVPPSVDVGAPSWYELVDPARRSAIGVDATLGGRRSRALRYEIAWALGAEPLERDFRRLAGGRASGRTRVHATLRTAAVPRQVWAQPLRHSSDLRSLEQHTITIRVRAIDARGNAGEDRRTAFVVHDPTLRPGFPRRVAPGEWAQPVMADLDGDRRLELIVGDPDGRVHAVTTTGRELPGWPASTSPLALAPTPAARAGAVPRAHEPILSPTAVGDLDGDGKLEVVAVSTSGRLYAFDRGGRLLAGWPKTLGAPGAPGRPRPHTRPPSLGAYAAPVLAPLPGGSKLDVLQAAWDGHLYAFDARGRALPGWPVDARTPAKAIPASHTLVDDSKLVATPTLADLDGDGSPEVVVKSQRFALGAESGFGAASRFYVGAFWGDGNRHSGGARVPGWPAELQGSLGYYGSGVDWLTEGGDSASAADVDGDGRDEVIQSTIFAPPQTIESDGSLARPTAPQPTISSALAESATGALTQLAGNVTRGAVLAAPHSDAATVPIGFNTSGVFGRLGGKLAYAAGGTDLVTVGALVRPGQQTRIANFMRAYDAGSGASLPGFPTAMMGLPFSTAPVIADVSGDGQPDVVNNEDDQNLPAFEASGAMVTDFPKFTGGWMGWTPAVGDLDGDGRNEVAALSREGYLFVWNTPGDAAASEAWSWHQDDWHTGRYGTDTRPPAALRPLPAAARGQACWAAPGDDWLIGRADRYRVVTDRGRALPAVKPSAAGARDCVTVPASVRSVAVRAFDDAGLGTPALTISVRAGGRP
jgi:hypothetical protein